MRKLLLRLLVPKNHIIISMDHIEEAPQYSIGFIRFNEDDN